MLLILRIVVIVLLVVAVQPCRGADTLYVMQGAASGGDGKGWSTAFTSLQAGIDAWLPGDEIWVARGTYDVDPVKPFIVKNTMRIYGGFKGTEVLREHRDWLRFKTILTADLLRNDGLAISPSDPLRLDNARHILEFASGDIDSTTIIDGLQFTGANGIATDGQAVVVAIGSPVFRNCHFYQNLTTDVGAAVFIRGVGRPRFDYCIFTRNRSQNGGAVYITPPIDSLTRGPFFSQCVFDENKSSEDGGAIFLSQGSRMEINSSIFYRNVAAGGGGAFFGSEFSFALIYNSTFAGNESGPDHGWMIEGRGADIVASIFWHGAEQTGDLILRPTGGEDTAKIYTRQCIVQNDVLYGFYQEDPEFIDVDNPTGNDGFWGTDDDGLRVLSTSICFDKGFVTRYTDHTRVDAVGNPRVVGNKPDIGAYEIQREGHDDYVAIMSEIRTGKLVLLYRHGITDWDQKDPGPKPECYPNGVGRNLSIVGRNQTKSVGKYIKALNVPIEDVFTSPVCRCWESALYMAGRYDIKSHWASGGGSSDALRHKDLSSIPVNGCRMINTHDAVIVPTIDATSAEIEEGDNAVLRPDGENFTWISHFTSDNWERYRIRFPDASVGVDYESPTERATQKSLNTLLYSANHIAVYNVLGAELLDQSGEPSQLSASLRELPLGWYAVVVTDIDGSVRASTFINEHHR